MAAGATAALVTVKMPFSTPEKLLPRPFEAVNPPVTRLT